MKLYTLGILLFLNACTFRHDMERIGGIDKMRANIPVSYVMTVPDQTTPWNLIFDVSKLNESELSLLSSSNMTVYIENCGDYTFNAYTSRDLISGEAYEHMFFPVAPGLKGLVFRGKGSKLIKFCQVIKFQNLNGSNRPDLSVRFHFISSESIDFGRDRLKLALENYDSI